MRDRIEEGRYSHEVGVFTRINDIVIALQVISSVVHPHRPVIEYTTIEDVDLPKVIHAVLATIISHARVA